ncbi:hypothetical protein DFH07DRAFT_328469 [Mycena maculata]|uniref:C2H2-type domain-containing protein n=1 Tax=Mycena maculata TaxID=230809 RepID=A0AAD7NM28_9AGAR|nr:hypothetical protein DFH07DRAFT_328469 [Mycena maculata]
MLCKNPYKAAVAQRAIELPVVLSYPSTSTVAEPSQSTLKSCTVENYEIMADHVPRILHPAPCTDSGCQVPPMSSECTEACVVVACTDDDLVCEGCPGNHCDLVCEDLNCKDCTGFDEFLQCCTDFHSYYEEPRNHPETAWSWDPSLKTFVCSCGGESKADMSPDPTLFDPPDNFPAHVDASVSTPGYCTPSSRAVSEAVNASLTCMWADCGASFDQLSDLAEHVNLIHLRHPPSLAPPASSDARDPFSMSCQWKDCTIYPTPDSVPGPSSGDIESMLFVLSSHLLHDHLGLNGPPTHLHTPQSSDLSPEEHRTEQPAVLPASSEDANQGGHVCRWTSCGQTFSSVDELTVHLTNVHVGAGKTSYDCFWQDCSRHDQSGFTSKQKLCRHLQSHTGHRPFQCKICLQNFSEAATLQQHMRRHTQEKPYSCDYPGCGKSFAITGALTIHKRTHNGHKPFKCSYCDKAFSESSNLSKHLRTHTGARPYTCSEPDCNKSFARADQLTRHARVHKKVSK